jgi:DNA-binding transcriptional MerR regulator
MTYRSQNTEGSAETAVDLQNGMSRSDRTRPMPGLRPGVAAAAAEEDRLARIASLIAGKSGIPADLDVDRASISELAAHFGVTLRALRFYEQSGLLEPRRRGMQRIYSRRDFHRIRLIVALRAYEASLPAIRTILDLIDGRADEAAVIARLEGLLVALVGDVRERIAELSSLDRSLSDAIGRIGGAV